MKYILSCLLILLTGCSLSPAKSYVHHISHSTVALMVEKADGSFAPFCSGVWIGDKKILTAAHCVDALAEHMETTTEHLKVHYTTDAEVAGIGEEPFAVHLSQVSVVDDDHDLAELVLLGLPVAHDTATLASGVPDVGQHVAIVGMPKGLFFTYEEGTISAVRDASFAGLTGKVLQVNSAAYFGNSGGGAFTEDGKLVGICSRLTPIPQMSLFVQVDINVIKKLESE